MNAIRTRLEFTHYLPLRLLHSILLVRGVRASFCGTVYDGYVSSTDTM